MNILLILLLADAGRFTSTDFYEPQHNQNFWDEVIRSRKNGSPSIKTSLLLLLMLLIENPGIFVIY